ncbi:MAG: POTRA domain-containing protein, partial [Thermodesulfobacteriota bacterium]|nr:POTRA domain-containing protein [Thermodesulfobacteriota bacterium]
MNHFLVTQEHVLISGHAKKFLPGFIAGFFLFVAGFWGHATAAYEGVFDSSGEIPLISNVVIDVRDGIGEEREWREMARSLILLREGEMFSETRLQESIESLRISKRFREITVDSIREKNGVTLIFHISPLRLIKDIEINGQFPLFKREILNAMTVYPGNVFIEEEIQKQAALTESFLKRQGFPSPAVHVTYKHDPEDGFFLVYVNIEKGPYSSLKRLEITGNQAFSDVTLKSKMSTWRSSFLLGSSGRFMEKKLKEDMEKLTRYYWKKGYPEAHMDFRIQKDDEEKSVSVLVFIDEGPFYDIEFVSNEEFWDMTLRKDLILFQKGNKGKLGMKKTVRKIKERYKEAGYLHTSVKVEEGAARIDDHKTVLPFRLIIDEKPRSIVHSIDIVGNTVFDDKKIKRQMLTKLPGVFEKGIFIPETFDEDLIAIKGLYLKYGYV